MRIAAAISVEALTMHGDNRGVTSMKFSGDGAAISPPGWNGASLSLNSRFWLECLRPALYRE